TGLRAQERELLSHLGVVVEREVCARSATEEVVELEQPLELRDLGKRGVLGVVARELEMERLSREAQVPEVGYGVISCDDAGLRHPCDAFLHGVDARARDPRDARRLERIERLGRALVRADAHRA